MSAHRFPCGQSLVVHGWFDRTVGAGRDQGAVNDSQKLNKEQARTRRP